MTIGICEIMKIVFWANAIWNHYHEDNVSAIYWMTWALFCGQLIITETVKGKNE